MRCPIFFITASSFVLSLSSLQAQILLDEVMSKEDQKKIGIATLSVKQKIMLEDWINQTFELKTIPSTTKSIPEEPDQAPLSLSININSGQMLELSDNSIWEVAPEDLPISATWLFPFPVKITPSDNPDYPFQLTNVNTGASIRARKSPPPSSST